MKDEQKPSRPPAGGQILNAAELYPRISEILGRTGDEVKLGGTVKESRTFDSRETTTYNWDYTITNPRMRQLYHRAKTAQWVAEDLPWDTDVDLEKPIFDIDPAMSQSDYMRKMGKKERARVTIQYNTNQICNFAQGEQGALLAAAQLAGAVPDIDSKYYAASQTLDEARHVEVFSRYVQEKLDTFFPCTQNLFNPIQAISVENRWDFKFLGMQMVVEGLAIAAFMSMLHRCHEPLFEKLIRLVLRDEARHVAFGVIALDGFYDDMNEKDRRERQEFVYEACMLMRGRLIGGEAFERMGLEPQKVRESLRDSAEAREFSALLFSQIVPNMKKIGLLDGWLEERFAEMEVLRYRDFDSDAILESLIGGNGEAAAAARMAG